MKRLLPDVRRAHRSTASPVLTAVCALLLNACAAPVARPPSNLAATLRAEVAAASAAAPAPAAAPVPAPAPAMPPEPRFDLIVSDARVRDVFQAMVSGTPYSMLMHPDVKGTISVTLRAVTLREALESIRDVYGYDYRIDGLRITIFPPTIQTRIFTVNYLTSQRSGRSQTRVSGGATTAGSSGNPATNNGAAPNASPYGSNSNANAPSEDSQITTTSNSDFWTETADALRALIGNAGGRVVVASPQAGTIAVRAMPDELREVAQFLRDSQVAIDREVMLEAKVVEVDLHHGYESGIDWSQLNAHSAAGQLSGNPANSLLVNPNGLPTLPATAAALLGDSIGLPQSAGGAFGLSLAAKGFQAVIGFLETSGDVQVLSSPRVATLNNQKAMLKVGTDAYFVTNVSGGSITPGGTGSNATTTLPSLTLTPFFSGIALDVTPQIDDDGMITLHLRPAVTSVTEVTKQIDLGTIGSYKLPLASSSVNETDTVVRVPDGQIVAIGGLMQSRSSLSRSGLPGTGGNAIGRNLLGNNADDTTKIELVVLIRPTVIRNAGDWQRSTERALAVFDQGPTRTIVVPSAAAAASSPAPGATAAAAAAAAAAATAIAITPAGHGDVVPR